MSLKAGNLVFQSDCRFFVCFVLASFCLPFFVFVYMFVFYPFPILISAPVWIKERNNMFILPNHTAKVLIVFGVSHYDIDRTVIRITRG